MQPGAPSFYPGASPTEFGTYGKQGRGDQVRVEYKGHLNSLIPKTLSRLVSWSKNDRVNRL